MWSCQGGIRLATICKQIFIVFPKCFQQKCNIWYFLIDKPHFYIISLCTLTYHMLLRLIKSYIKQSIYSLLTMTEALKQNIARDTKDPEIDPVTWTKFGTTCTSFKCGHHDNHSDLAIKSDTGQHSQFLRCFLLMFSLTWSFNYFLCWGWQ